ncbi:PepSY domain-containing protein [Sphingomonas trueperi]|uniref:PepSY domain-containing protein n=1 Tax=Sphingomonas TaxID=13687 RepID=UPI000F2AA630
MKRSLASLAMMTALAVITPAIAGGAGKLHGAKYLPLARIPLAKARAAALKARPGTITDQELEKEKGGSGLRYSFDVRRHSKTYEVGIDAKTGKILENRAEGPHPD